MELQTPHGRTDAQCLPDDLTLEEHFAIIELAVTWRVFE